MINILVWFLLSAPMIVEIIIDKIDFKKGKKDKKILDIILRAGALLPLTYLTSHIDHKTMWQGYVLAIGLYVMFFDYIIAWLMFKNPFYLGKTSKLDQLWAMCGPIGGFVIRGILFGICLTAYYAPMMFVCGSCDGKY